jgi:hypothetical protein
LINVSDIQCFITSGEIFLHQKLGNWKLVSIHPKNL